MLYQKSKETEIQLKEALLSKIAHEFKTPLTSIITIIDDLEQQIELNKLDEMKKSIFNIQNLSHYTVFLINDIIQYSSNQNNNIKIHKETVNLRVICKFCHDIQKCLLGSYSSKKKVQSILEYDDSIDSLEVISDEIRLKQILLNLVSNSVKFTKSGSIKITAKCVDRNDPINRTSSSIKKEYLKKLQSFNSLRNIAERRASNSVNKYNANANSAVDEFLDSRRIDANNENKEFTLDE